MYGVVSQKRLDAGSKQIFNICPYDLCIISLFSRINVTHDIVFQQLMVFKLQTTCIEYFENRI